MVRNVNSPSKFILYSRFLQVMINNQVDYLSSHTTKYTSPALTQKGFANMRRIGKGFSGIETLLFTTMLVQPQAVEEEEVGEDEVPAAPTPPSPPQVQSPTPPSPPQAQPAPPSSSPQKQPIAISESFITLLNTLMEKIKAIDADEDITLVDVETQEQEVDLCVELQRNIERKDDDNVAAKEVNAVEPTVFDDEEMAKRLQDEEIKQAAAREKQDQDDLKIAQVLQQQYEDKAEDIDWNVVAEQIQEKHLDNIKKYQKLKRKPIFIAQERKNMIIYLKNMVGYKMEHFEGSESTQDTPTIDPKEMSEEYVQNVLQIVPVAEFKIESLQVKYPLIDWEIYSEGSISY
nr:hypothetical protein [Tanacetum cinerariifolium]